MNSYLIFPDSIQFDENMAAIFKEGRQKGISQTAPEVHQLTLGHLRYHANQKSLLDLFSKLVPKYGLAHGLYTKAFQTTLYQAWMGLSSLEGFMYYYDVYL